ncbi:MAG: MipA/OmpV family protein [Pseudomonadota bacterium]
MRSLTYFVAVLACAATPTMAHAEFQGPGESEGLTLGVAVLADFSAYEGVDEIEANPVPYIAYDWENLHIGIDGINYDFWDNDVFELTVFADPRFAFTDPDESPLFAGIDRKTTVEAGLGARFNAGPAYAEIRGQYDILDVHNGYEASARIGLEVEVGKASFDLAGGVSYRDEKLNDHLFGVRADEARADLAQFSPQDSLEPFVSADIALQLGRRSAVIAFADFRLLRDEVRESPLIGRKYTGTAGVAFLRRF